MDDIHSAVYLVLLEQSCLGVARWWQPFALTNMVESTVVDSMSANYSLSSFLDLHFSSFCNDPLLHLHHGQRQGERLQAFRSGSCLLCWVPISTSLLVDYVKYSDSVGEDGENHEPEPSVNWEGQVPADKG